MFCPQKKSFSDMLALLPSVLFATLSRKPSSIYSGSVLRRLQYGSRRLQKLSLEEGDGMDFFKQLRSKLGEDELVLALTVTRLIWLRHNDFVFRHQFTPPSILLCQAVDSVQAFTEANQRITDDLPGQDSVLS